MAHLANSTTPMVPYGGSGGTLAANVETFYSEGNGIEAGDIIIWTGDVGEYVDFDNAEPPQDEVIGVCVGSNESAAGDPVMVALATPGTLFEGSLVAGANDLTAGVNATHLGARWGSVESDDGFACLSTGSVIEFMRTLWWGRQINTDSTTVAGGGTNSDRLNGGVGILNPKVIFVFYSSVFSPVLDGSV